MKKQIPEFLLNMFNKQYGTEYTNKILEGYKKSRYLTLRINTLKSNTEEIKNYFKKENIIFKEVEWSNDALIILNAKEDTIRKSKIYKDGKIYLQSLSSMLPPIILEPKKGEAILDMTAAPGGKTTQIAAITNNESTITACEMNKIRAEKLKYNIEKQGASSVYIMVTDSRKLDDFFSFDKILLDAPCSGSGTITIEKTDFEKVFTQKLILKCIASQKQLLKKAINILKPGGEIIYSTCSIINMENEEVIKEMLDKKRVEIISINKDILKGVPLLPTEIDGTICVCPNELYEGFFIAKLKKL